MLSEDLKKRLLDERLPEGEFNSDADEVSVVSASLPRISSSANRALHRRIGFWPDTIKRCKKLELNQAVKVRLLSGENPTSFAATARAVAKQHGFYLNTVFKYPFMYIWPDKMRGRVLPEDFNSKGAVFFEEVDEVKGE